METRHCKKWGFTSNFLPQNLIYHLALATAPVLRRDRLFLHPSLPVSPSRAGASTKVKRQVLKSNFSLCRIDSATYKGDRETTFRSICGSNSLKRVLWQSNKLLIGYTGHRHRPSGGRKGKGSRRKQLPSTDY